MTSSNTNFKFTILFISLLLTSNLLAQSLKVDNNLSIGIGNSLYNNIQTKQMILFYQSPELSTTFSNFSLESDFNLELIFRNNSTIIVAGLVPMFRYDITLMGTDTFIKAGVGFNYINNHNISTRNLGSHFIFSDMISIGSRIIKSDKYSVEISYLLRHISNAGIFDSNEGFNSQYIVVSIII